jgi:hypothetical protein
MNIIFKDQNNNILENLSNDEIDQNIADELAIKYDNKKILSYTIEPSEKATVKNFHHLDELDPSFIKNLVITIEN